MFEDAKTTSAEAILAMLSLGEMTGYELRQMIEQSIGNFWSESFGQIYPTLKRLETNGLVSVSEGSRPGSKVYTLTGKGWERFRQWLGILPQPQVIRNELLLKVFFGDHAEHAIVREQIEQERLRLEANLERYRAIEDRLRGQLASHPGLPFWLMTVNYGKTQAAALIGWCDESLATLQSMSAKLEEAVR